MAKIAIMGFGTIGSGVYDVLTTNAEEIRKRTGEDVTVARILDRRSFDRHPAASLVTQDFNEILNDPEIEIVVETMGGTEPAFSFEMQLLAAGRHVVTSNKELVEKKGPELFAAARAAGVNFFFEASVGGGIPIIRNLTSCITADRIDRICGILNGTTNYILTEMCTKGVSYDETLKKAQELGYAEKDPTADVEGHDAGRKIAILASMVLGKSVHFEDLKVVGIPSINSTDFLYARELGMSIKLVASADFADGGVCAMVAPRLVPADNPLYGVNDVFNAVTVQGNMVDSLMFYGRGAGAHATASAVCADVLEALRRRNETVYGGWSAEEAKLIDSGRALCRYLIRVNGGFDEIPAAIRFFGGGSPVSVIKGEFGLVTPELTEEDLDEICASLPGFIKKIRIL